MSFRRTVCGTGLLLLVMLGIAAFSPGIARALEQKIIASDGDAGDDFGAAVAVSGDTAIVGALENDDAGLNSGSAYVYTLSGGVWTEQQKLTASDADAGDQFGKSVAIDGDTAVVGAHGENGARGAVYVFTRSVGVWTEQQKLIAPDAAIDDQFGNAVAISGDTVIIGAHYDDTKTGSAYVFTRSGGVWTYQQKLVGASVWDYFGTCVSVSADTALVGAYAEDGGGAAYVYTRTGGVWSQEQRITAADQEAGDEFGRSVAVLGDTALIGNWQDDDVGDRCGSAYVYTRSGTVWTEQAKLLPEDAENIDYFGGYSVALTTDAAIIPAHSNNHWADNSGSAYIFTRSGSTWSQQAKLVAFDAAENNNFGYSVGISGDNVIVGVAENDHLGAGSGAAYTFVKSGGVWTNQQEQKVTAPDAEPQELFGSAVAIDGDLAVIGAYSDDGVAADEGSAYFYSRTGSVWRFEQKVYDPFAGDSDPDTTAGNFGYSVDVSGDTAVIGAYGDWFMSGPTRTDPGAAHVYVRSGGVWSLQQTLDHPAPNGALNGADQFGFSVAIDGDTIVVGAKGKDNTGGDRSGAAYVFTRSAGIWTLQQTLTPSDSEAIAYFGCAVSINSDTAVVGALADNAGGVSNSGAAYVFTRTGGIWTQQQKLSASDKAANDNFGFYLDVAGDTAVISSWLADVEGPDTNNGALYVFTRSGSTWTQQQKLTSTGSSQLGRSVSISADESIITGGPSNGDRCYVYLDNGGTWSEKRILSASDAAAGQGFGAIASICDNTALVGAYVDDGNWPDSGSAFFIDLDLPTAMPNRATVLDTQLDSLSYGWNDNAIDETGYKVYADPGVNPPTTQQDTTSADVTSWLYDTLSANTAYSFQVAGTDGVIDSESSPNLTWWTLIEPVGGLTFSSVGETAISVASSNTPSNLGDGVSGLYFENTTEGTSNNWQPDNTPWVSSGLSPNTEYTFSGKSRNGMNVETAAASDSAWTMIEAPSGLAFSGITENSISVASANTPSNLATDSSGLFFENQTAGTDGGWQQDNTPWTSSSLLPNTQYTFNAKSRNAVAVESAPASDSVWTLAVTPVAPVVDNPTGGTLDVTIGTGDGNPAGTEYAIYCVTTSQWVQTNGSLGATTAWQTAAAWGSKTVTGLAENAAYAFVARARNGGDVETTDGPLAAGTTSDVTDPSSAAAVSDATQVGGDITGTYSASDSGSGVASVELYVKEPGGSWTNMGTVTGGTFTFAPSSGDGLYRFATVATDNASNSETAPTGSDEGDVSVLWNNTANTPFAWDSIGAGTYTFPMTADLDIAITFSGSVSGGPVTVSRATGDVAPTGYSPNGMADESWTITADGSVAYDSATIVFSYDEGNLGLDETLLDRAYRDASGTVTEMTITLDTAGNTATVTGVTSFSTWYLGNSLGLPVELDSFVVE